MPLPFLPSGLDSKLGGSPSGYCTELNDARVLLSKCPPHPHETSGPEDATNTVQRSSKTVTKCAGTATPRTALGRRIDVVASSILDGTCPPDTSRRTLSFQMNGDSKSRLAHNTAWLTRVSPTAFLRTRLYRLRHPSHRIRTGQSHAHCQALLGWLPNKKKTCDPLNSKLTPSNRSPS